jgi:Fe-S cluster biosynthesis and repair protein YggX
VTANEFQTQMNRMIETWGKPAYSTERCSLIWREVGHFSAEWWKAAVDRMIGEHRQAPLLPEIRKVAAEERERVSYREKAKHTAEAEQGYRTILQSEDIKHFARGILKRVEGHMPDQDFTSLVRLMSATVGGK